MAKKNTSTPKRIPPGTVVSWRARYDHDPLNTGIVQEFVAAGAVPQGGSPWEKATSSLSFGLGISVIA